MEAAFAREIMQTPANVSTPTPALVDPHTASWGSAPLAAADQRFIIQGMLFHLR